MKLAKFEIGQNIIHVKQQYRGVVVDADENFLTSSGQPLSQLKDNHDEEPWYRVLIDDSDVISYVRESMLELDEDSSPIHNPRIKEFLTKDRFGHYHRQEKFN